jgi:catechol 2,3-dioxygenase
MSEKPAIWPSRLHHIRIDSTDPAGLIPFYRDGVGLRERPLAEDTWLLDGRKRRIVIGRGAKNGLAFAAFAMADAAAVDALRADLESRQVPIEPSPTPLFDDDAIAVRDPEGRPIVFGVPAMTYDGADGLAGRLQHFVVATTDLPRLHAFYGDTLGLVVSDEVIDGESGEVTARFYRSDPEHHSFAAFRAPESAFDHHAYEADCWNDLRDWADHFSRLRVTLFWGPGRHGPGDNLFFMVCDPDGNKVEISAELEHMPLTMAKRTWPHEERTLNYWGQAWMRS